MTGEVEIQQVQPVQTCRTSGFVIGALIATACFGIGALVVWLVLRKKESWVLSGMLAAKASTPVGLCMQQLTIHILMTMSAMVTSQCDHMMA